MRMRYSKTALDNRAVQSCSTTLFPAQESLRYGKCGTVQLRLTAVQYSRAVQLHVGGKRELIAAMAGPIPLDVCLCLLLSWSAEAGVN